MSVLKSKVDVDEITRLVCEPFDYEFNGEIEFQLPDFDAPKRDGTWGIGLIVGPSGSGKTQLLKLNYGIQDEFVWMNGKSIASHFADPADARKRLSAVGLNSIPSWCKPFNVLSNGEKFRASLAMGLKTNSSIDEFTSVVDRTVAKSCSSAVQKFIRNQKMSGIVFASCHYDIIEWLEPDWCYDTMGGSMLPRGCLQRRPTIRLTVEACNKFWWDIFRQHHYMTSCINNSSEMFIIKWDNNPIGFTSCIAMPSGTLKNAWREHRTVVLPDYQGLGIGVRISDWLAERCRKMGRRYFSKTSHPRMGEYRNNSSKWRKTSKNNMIRRDRNKKNYNGISNTFRINKFSYSHEYMGDNK
jgi:hypothetical protein